LSKLRKHVFQAQISFSFVKKETLFSMKKLPKSTREKKSPKVLTIRGFMLILGIAFPTAISPNNTVAHSSPIGSEPEAETTLKAGDVVKISLGAHIDGFAGILADTIIVPEKEGGEQGEITGRKADVLMAAWLASEAAMRVVKPGAKNYAVTEAVGKVAAAFGCKPLEGDIPELVRY
jgi:methionine aminopeptidase